MEARGQAQSPAKFLWNEGEKKSVGKKKQLRREKLRDARNWGG